MRYCFSTAVLQRSWRCSVLVSAALALLRRAPAVMAMLALPRDAGPAAEGPSGHGGASKPHAAQALGPNQYTWGQVQGPGQVLCKTSTLLTADPCTCIACLFPHGHTLLHQHQSHDISKLFLCSRGAAASALQSAVHELQAQAGRWREQIPSHLAQATEMIWSSGANANSRPSLSIPMHSLCMPGLPRIAS